MEKECKLKINRLNVFNFFARKNDFAKISKNLVKYRLENNFIGPK